MMRVPILIFVLLCITCSVANSQELHEWKSKAGHTTRAALFKVDEENRKITLLIPKEIDFEKLDDDSIALARKLAVTLGKPVEEGTAITRESDEMRFLRTKYEALTRFKTSKEFAEWGFSIGGP